MTPVHALLAKSRESLDAARLLANGGYHNFAVSRAYYAMFYAAEAFLLTRDLSFSKHSAVIASFGHHFVKTGEVLPHFHRYLIEGQEGRNVGDYDLTTQLGPEEAAEQIRRAEEFLSLAEKHLIPA